MCGPGRLCVALGGCVRPWAAVCGTGHIGVLVLLVFSSLFWELGDFFLRKLLEAEWAGLSGLCRTLISPQSQCFKEMHNRSLSSWALCCSLLEDLV